jgi:DNA-directed RNA polymerase subunit K/omega
MNNPVTTLTKYEMAALIGARIEQLAHGAPSTIDTRGMTDVRAIAIKEFETGASPISVVRRFPDNKTQVLEG